MFALVVAKSEMKMGKSLVKISDSGEMEFRRGGVGNASEDAHPIKIKMDEIMQVDNNGTELTDCAEASNSSKPGMGWINNVLKKTAMKIKMRRFRDFAKQNFNFEAKRSKVAMRHAMKSVKAAVQKFQTSLPDGIGKITIDLALPEEDGDIDIDGEKQKLKIGDMKFNIEMSEWTWCDNAAFLDVYMKLASKKKPTKRQARSKSLPVSYDLGGNKTVSFSGKVGSLNDAQMCDDEGVLMLSNKKMMYVKREGCGRK